VKESGRTIRGLPPGSIEQRQGVTDPVAYGIAILGVLVALFAAWHTATRHEFGNPLFYAVSVLEIALLALLVGGSIALGSTTRDVDGVLFISYLVTMVVIPPAAVVWGIAEKSRWGTGVVVVAMLSVAVLSIRLLGIWKGTYA
jgi:uncharacterized membrane protein